MTPAVVVLTFACILANFGAWLLGVAADANQSEAPTYPLVLALTTSGALHVVGALLPQILGIYLFPKTYSLYQPFTGGQAFVVLQSCGYFFAVLSAMGVPLYYKFVTTYRVVNGKYVLNPQLSMTSASSTLPDTFGKSTVSMENSNSNPAHIEVHFGILTALSMCGFLANSALLASTFLFDESTVIVEEAIEEAIRLVSPVKSGINRTHSKGLTCENKRSNQRRKTSMTRAKATSLLSSLSISPRREAVIVTTLIFANIGVCMTGWMEPAFRDVCAVIFLVFHLSCGVVMHAVVGWQYTENYRLFMPLLRSADGGVSIKATAAQACIWFVFVLSTQLALFLRMVGKESPEAAAFGFAVLAVLGPASVSGLVAFVWTFSHRPPHSASLLAQHGPSIINYAVVCLVAEILLVGALLRFTVPPTSGDDVKTAACLCAEWINSFLSQHSSSAATSYLGSLDGILDWMTGLATEHSSTLLAALERSQNLCGCLLLWMVPLTHLVGSLVHGESYDIYQPFRGPSNFVIFQAVGWTLYALGAFVFLVHFTTLGDLEAREVCLMVFAFTLLASQLAIYTSIHLFNSTQNNTHRSGPNKKTQKKQGRVLGVGNAASSPSLKQKQQHRRLDAATLLVVDEEDTNKEKVIVVEEKSLAKQVLNGEAITGLLLAAVGILLRSAVDVLERTDGAFHHTQLLTLGVGAAMATVATPIIHSSTRDLPAKGLPGFQPFSGPPEVVGLQAVGWTVYSVMLLFDIIVYASVAGGYPLWSSPTTGTQSLSSTGYSSGGHAPLLVHTLIGILSLVPFTLIAASVVVLRQAGERLEKGVSTSMLALAASLSSIKDPGVRAQVAANMDELLSNVNVVLPVLAANAASRQSSSSASSPPRFHHGTVFSHFVNPDNRRRGILQSDSEDEYEHLSALRSPLSSNTSAIIILAQLLCFTCVCFIVAIVRIDHSVVCGGFAIGGVVLTIMSCALIHWVYGPFVHGSQSYRAFMPFVGGMPFVLLQAAGWNSLSGAVLLVCLFLCELSVGYLAIVAAGLLAVLAQVLLFMSVSHFQIFQRRTSYRQLLHLRNEQQPSQHQHQQQSSIMNALEEHAEGAVSVLVFLAAFALTHTYETFGLRQVGVMPIIISSAALTLALPLGAVALRKASTKSLTQQQNTTSTFVAQIDDYDDDEEDDAIAAGFDESLSVSTPSRRIKSSKKRPNRSSCSSSSSKRRNNLRGLMIAPYGAMELVVLGLLFSTPMLVIYVTYYFLTGQVQNALRYEVGTQVGYVVVGGSLAVALLSRSTIFRAYLSNASVVARVHAISVLPSFVVFTGFVPPFIVPWSVGTCCASGTIVLLTFVPGRWKQFIGVAHSLLAAALLYQHVASIYGVITDADLLTTTNTTAINCENSTYTAV